AHKITQLYGNSQTYDFSEFYAAMDLVFIDGAHHYDAVVNDTNNALKMIRPGGVIVWHDFANYGDYNDVTRAALDTIGADAIVQLERTQLAIYRAPLP
ncbi:MAG TPA: class I SAM-dependent methyltransferase, partial [candidate division Zixibacteria bacterium]|nr:class I SAM-dependent methyltransferase [candidate division Zixibacteria bacterium]